MKIIVLSIYILTFSLLNAQERGAIHLGVVGQYQSNLFKYKAVDGQSNFESVRTANSYGVGLAIDFSLIEALKLDVKTIFSEQNYNPNLGFTNGTSLFKINVRAIHIIPSVQLRLGANLNKYGTISVGMPFQQLISKTEITNNTSYKSNYKSLRTFFQLGLGYNMLFNKEKFLLKPEVGLRFKPLNRLSWENNFNQFFAGITFSYLIKKS